MELRQLLENASLRMSTDLSDIRNRFENTGDRGSAAEDILTEFLRHYLPRKYDIGRGEIIDSFGNRSSQTDLVITNEYHPFSYKRGEPGLFFIEGVLAVIESKMILTSKELTSSLHNASKYKALCGKPTKGEMVYANPHDRERFYAHGPSILFAFDSELTLETIRSKIIKHMNVHTTDFYNTLDAVYVLNRGSVINYANGLGSYSYRLASGDDATGWHVHGSSDVLFDLLAYLSVNTVNSVKVSPILTNYLFADDGSLNRDEILDRVNQ